MRVTIFIEGGGDRNDLKTQCRRGFRIFLERAGFRGRMPTLVACGSRGEALDKFKKALQDAGPDNFPMLLVDSEQPVRPEHQGKSWDYLVAIVGPDRLDRPDGATDEQVHLMVQCMESWFLADRDCLASYFGQHFQAGTLPGRTDIEQIEPQHVLDRLKDATRHCQKGRYDKKRHSFAILAGLDPVKVEGASAHARRLFEALRGKVAG